MIVEVYQQQLWSTRPCGCICVCVCVGVYIYIYMCVCVCVCVNTITQKVSTYQLETLIQVFDLATLTQYLKISQFTTIETVK